MDFVVQWLCYLLAFAAGSAAACVVASVVVKRGANKNVPANAAGGDGMVQER